MGAGRAPGWLPGSAAHFKVCKAKREAPELFRVDFLFHREVPEGESCPHAGHSQLVISGRAGAGERGLSRALPLIPKTSCAGQAALGRACPGVDVTSPDAGTASAVSPTTQRGDNCSSAATSQPSRECLRLHTQRLKINSVATRDKEKSVQGDTFPAPRSKRSILCLCQHLLPAASRSHLPLLNASAVPAAAQSSPARCQGMPGPFWNVFTEKFAIVLTKVLAAHWSEQVWLCSAGHHIITTCDSVSGVQLSG